MTIEITKPELEELIEKRMRTGAFANVEDVLIDALRTVTSELPTASTRNSRTRAAAEGLIELRKQVKPDPDGWTIRDYIDYGRRY